MKMFLNVKYVLKIFNEEEEKENKVNKATSI